MSERAPDVEFDAQGRLVWARSIKLGDVVTIPSHMWRAIGASSLGGLVRDPDRPDQFVYRG